MSDDKMEGWEGWTVLLGLVLFWGWLAYLVWYIFNGVW